MSAGAHATLPPAIRAARMLAAAVEARADLKHGAAAMEQAAWGVDPARAKSAAPFPRK